MKGFCSLVFAAAVGLSIAVSTTSLLAAPAAAPKHGSEAAKKPKGIEKSLPGLEDDFGKLPTYIKADTLSVDNDKRTFNYSGNIEVRQGDMTLSSDFLDGTYTEDNKIQQLVARSNVVIVKGNNIRATGGRGVYDAQAQTVVLTESPELQENKNVLTADSIIVYLQDNRSVAQGTVRMKVVNDQSNGEARNILGVKKR